MLLEHSLKLTVPSGLVLEPQFDPWLWFSLFAIELYTSPHTQIGQLGII